MEIVTDRTEYEILSILDRKNRAVNAHIIEKELQGIGVDISRRRIIQYLELLDEKGFSSNLGRDGRRITASGIEEVKKAMVQTKINYVVDKTIKLSTEMSIDLDKRKGNVVANLSVIDANKKEDTINILKEICSQTNWVSPFIKIANAGDIVCDYEVPAGKIGLITISSITVEGILIDAGIYTIPKYGGLVEFIDHKPIRFTTLYPAENCSFDAMQEFVASDNLSIFRAIKEGRGIVPGDYREYPNIARTRVINVLQRVVRSFGGLIFYGDPNSPLLGIHPPENYGGIGAFGGELLVSALEERKISTNTRFVYSVIDFDDLQPISDVKGALVKL